jgi:hypothetical protein
MSFASAVRARLPLRGALWIASAFALQCARAPSGYIEVVLDTDVPPGVTMTITVRVIPLRSEDDARGPRDAAEDARPAPPAHPDASDAGALDANALDGGDLDASTLDASSPDAWGEPGLPSEPTSATLEVDPAVRSFVWTRTTDGGVALPASFSVLPSTIPGEPVLLEARIETEGEPATSSRGRAWRQYALLRPRAGQREVVRMFLSRRCGAPATGCLRETDWRCAVDLRCIDRGQTCGDDGQCASVDHWPRFAAADGPCEPGRCGPRCAPCPVGTQCGGDGACTSTPEASVPCRDLDADGFGVGPGCLGPDCDDADPLNNPGNVESCDGRDNDCDGAADDRAACDDRANRTCATALSLDLTNVTRVALNGDTRRGGSLLEPACRFAGHQGGTGRELWFRVTYPGDQELDARAITSRQLDTDTVLLAFEDCTRGSLVACNDDVMAAGDTSSRVVLHPAPGSSSNSRTILLAVDSWNTVRAGPFRLEITRRTPTSNTSCPAAYDTTMGGTFAGQLSPADRPRLACAPSGSTDGRYFLLPARPQSASVQASVPDRRASVALALASTCAQAASAPCVLSERATEDSANVLLTPPGRSVYAVVEGAPGARFMLNVSGSDFSY